VVRPEPAPKRTRSRAFTSPSAEGDADSARAASAAEIAAVIRWRAGRRLDSPALVADGNHARADGYVSAVIIVSTVFIAVGLPIADPIIGLLITALIVHTTWQSWATVRRG